MREAVVVSYARTGLAKSGRGGFNMTPTVSMAAHAIKHAVEKAGIDKASVEDVFLGNVAHGSGNLGRQASRTTSTRSGRMTLSGPMPACCTFPGANLQKFSR